MVIGFFRLHYYNVVENYDDDDTNDVVEEEQRRTRQRSSETSVCCRYRWNFIFGMMMMTMLMMLRSSIGSRTIKMKIKMMMDLWHLGDILKSVSLWEAPADGGGEIDSLTRCGAGGEWEIWMTWLWLAGGGDLDIRGGGGGEVEVWDGGGGESSSKASSCERGARATIGWQGLPWKHCYQRGLWSQPR